MSMKTFELKIEMNNDAFEGPLANPEGEVARILRNLADKVEGMNFNSMTQDQFQPTITLKDFNGNTVGKVVLDVEGVRWAG